MKEREEPARQRAPLRSGLTVGVDWLRRMSRDDRRALARLAVLWALAAGGYLAIVLSGPLSVDRARDFVDARGALAPLVFVAVSASLVLVSFPAPLLAGASGILFGIPEGTALSLAAATIGATAAHQLGRHAAGPVFAKARGGRIGGLVQRLRERSFLSVLYARILPGLPFAVVSYAAGIAAVGLRAFVPATALGAAPRAYAYTALGGHIHNLGDPQALVAFGILVALAIGSLVLHLKTRGRR
jgi:uncharacterized membrane protein YdjX (TVP38/TMEM64 family)